MWEARKRFSEEGSQRISEMGEVEIMFWFWVREAGEREERGWAYIFVDSDVFLGVGFKPYYVSCGSAHYYVDVVGCFGK